MKVKNSLSTFLEQSLILNQNSLETFDKMCNAMTSREETVTITLTDPNDPSRKEEYSFPSFGHLKSEIDRLSATLETITNVTDGAGSRIRLSDGSYRKIISSKVPSEAPTITSVGNITNFNFKSNWFFEDMLNPCLYITWDLSNQISLDTEKIMIQRYILNCNSQKKRDLFNDTLKGRNDIDYKEFLKLIYNNKIKYTLDDEVKELPPRAKRYYGTFSVSRIVKENDLNGNSVTRYILDSLEFTDARSGFENTRILSIGDFVEVNSIPTTTRFEVIYSEPSENKIGLRCVEGCEGVRIGVDTLKISASQDSEVSADIPIGFDEREVIFIKAIDPDSNIPSNKWSPGVAFYTNELTYLDGNGVTQTLKNFYQKNVIDFGQILLSYAYDYYPASREGIKPDAPILNYLDGAGDFKIVQINNQLTESTDSATFRSLIADKIKVQSELDNINNAIAKQKELIQTTQYTSTNEKLKAQSTLNTLIDNQETLTANYASIVNNIKSKYESGYGVDPKYRVRGFWDIPKSKVSSSSGEQKIIKFKIRYRYLSESGNTNKEEEFSYISGASKVTGRFSNWNEIESKLRPRVLTPTGWEWDVIDTSDPDAVNINQLDIPINPGEKVEIEVKSVSEAGWPSNPMESEWSDSIVVAFSDFPELQADSIAELMEQNKVDAAVANVAKMFNGASVHMSSSFYTNDKYFAHTAENITSGFLSPEQTPITLYDKLQELQNQINMIIEQINGAVGELNVVFVDESDESKIYTLNEGGVTYINAGDYTSAVSGLDDSKKNGAIITKIYYMDISTDAQSGLYLLSKLSGNRHSMCPNTITDTAGRLVQGNPNVTNYDGNNYEMYDNVIIPSTSSSNYYMEQGRYDLVPINLTSPEILDFQIGSPCMYQSAQCKGQFVYSRFRDIGDTFDMYANTNMGSTDKQQFSYDAPFLDSEVIPDGTQRWNNGDYYTSAGASSEMDSAVNEYNYLTGSDVTCTGNAWWSSNNEDIYKILNRLPKTWEKLDTATAKLLNYNSKMSKRATNQGGTIDVVVNDIPVRTMMATPMAVTSSAPTVNTFSMSSPVSEPEPELESEGEVIDNTIEIAPIRLMSAPRLMATGLGPGVSTSDGGSEETGRGDDMGNTNNNVEEDLVEGGGGGNSGYNDPSGNTSDNPGSGSETGSGSGTGTNGRDPNGGGSRNGNQNETGSGGSIIPGHVSTGYCPTESSQQYHVEHMVDDNIILFYVYTSGGNEALPVLSQYIRIDILDDRNDSINHGEVVHRTYDYLFDDDGHGIDDGNYTYTVYEVVSPNDWRPIWVGGSFTISTTPEPIGGDDEPGDEDLSTYYIYHQVDNNIVKFNIYGDSLRNNEVSTGITINIFDDEENECQIITHYDYDDECFKSGILESGQYKYEVDFGDDAYLHYYSSQSFTISESVSPQVTTIYVTVTVNQSNSKVTFKMADYQGNTVNVNPRITIVNESNVEYECIEDEDHPNNNQFQLGAGTFTYTIASLPGYEFSPDSGQFEIGDDETPEEVEDYGFRITPVVNNQTSKVTFTVLRYDEPCDDNIQIIIAGNTPDNFYTDDRLTSNTLSNGTYSYSARYNNTPFSTGSFIIDHNSESHELPDTPDTPGGTDIIAVDHTELQYGIHREKTQVHISLTSPTGAEFEDGTTPITIKFYQGSTLVKTDSCTLEGINYACFEPGTYRYVVTCPGYEILYKKNPQTFVIEAESSGSSTSTADITVSHQLKNHNTEIEFTYTSQRTVTGLQIIIKKGTEICKTLSMDSSPMSVADLEPGAYTYDASCSSMSIGYNNTPRSFTIEEYVAPDPTRIKILDTSYGTSSRIYAKLDNNVTGDPVSGVRIIVSAGNQTYEATTGEDGWTEIYDLPEGSWNYDAQIEVDGNWVSIFAASGQNLSWITIPGRNGELALTFSEPYFIGNITGLTLFDSGYVTRSDIPVKLYGGGYQIGEAQKTNSLGAVQFTGLTPGEYTATAELEHYLPASKTFTVSRSSSEDPGSSTYMTVGCNVVNNEVHFTAMAQGQALSNVIISISKTSMSSSTTSQGQAMFTISSNGTYTYTASKSGYNTCTGTFTISGMSDSSSKMDQRVSNLSNDTNSTYTIIPKIQAAYGFADMGRILGIKLDNSDVNDDGSYLTTHKIGYEDKDRFAIGDKTCNSYLFMSPINHKHIQVEGDTMGAAKLVKNRTSLRVPIIYQYRMTDYDGNIFGDSSKSSTDLDVKNAKFANIIGLDIWTDVNALRPKQYDVIVYSTYGNVIETNTGKTKTSTQALINAGESIASKLDRLVKDNRSLSSTSTILGTTKTETKLI